MPFSCGKRRSAPLGLLVTFALALSRWDSQFCFFLFCLFFLVLLLSFVVDVTKLPLKM
jgi:hypothetical protein